MFTVKSVIYRHVETEIIYFTEIPRTNLVVPIKDKSMFFCFFCYMAITLKSYCFQVLSIIKWTI